MSLTDAVEIDLLKAFVGKATTIFSITVITPYIALYTVAPSDSAAGTEVSGSSYARQSAPSATWPTPSAGSVANTTAVLFPAVTGSGYTVLGAGLCDAVSAGNLLRWQAISSLALAVADQANFPVGSITFTMD
jgi:hypothetical protein